MQASQVMIVPQLNLDFFVKITQNWKLFYSRDFPQRNGYMFSKLDSQTLDTQNGIICYQFHKAYWKG